MEYEERKKRAKHVYTSPILKNVMIGCNVEFSFKYNFNMNELINSMEFRVLIQSTVSSKLTNGNY